MEKGNTPLDHTGLIFQPGNLERSSGPVAAVAFKLYLVETGNHNSYFGGILSIISRFSSFGTAIL